MIITDRDAIIDRWQSCACLNTESRWLVLNTRRWRSCCTKRWVRNFSSHGTHEASDWTETRPLRVHTVRQTQREQRVLKSHKLPMWQRMFACVCVCVCVCVCSPLVFNFSAGPFCMAPQDKLPCMVVFERQCSAQRKGQGWNTGNRPIKIHHFDLSDLPLLGGCTHKHTHTHKHVLAHPPKLTVRAGSKYF